MARPLPHRCRFACHCLERAKSPLAYYYTVEDNHDRFNNSNSTPENNRELNFLDDMSILRARAKNDSKRRSILAKSKTQRIKSATTSPFPLLKLPFEIRQLVFRVLLISPSDITFCLIRLQGRLKLPSQRIYPQILETSKRMNHEGRPILYHENTFGITHTLALTSDAAPRERIHVQKCAYECDGAGFWSQIRHLRLTIRTSSRNGQRAARESIRRIAAYVIRDAAPLRSLRVEVVSDEDPWNDIEVSVASEELYGMLEPLTALRVDGIVIMDTNDISVSERLKKAITGVAHPVPTLKTRSEMFNNVTAQARASLSRRNVESTP